MNTRHKFNAPGMLCQVVLREGSRAAIRTLGGVHVGGALTRLVSPGSIQGGEKFSLAAVQMEMGTEEGRGAPSRTLLAEEGSPFGPVCPALAPTVLHPMMS